jgi:hypothetical protein
MMLEGFLTGLIGNILKEVITQAIQAIRNCQEITVSDTGKRGRMM